MRDDDPPGGRRGRRRYPAMRPASPVGARPAPRGWPVVGRRAPIGRARAAPRPGLRLLVVAAALVVLVLAIGTQLFGLGPGIVRAVTGQPSQERGAAGDGEAGPTPTATPTPTPTRKPDAAEFVAVDGATLDAIAVAPDLHEGERLKAYAEILAIADGDEGAPEDVSQLLVGLSASRPAAQHEFVELQAALVGDATSVSEVAVGDLLLVQLTVTPQSERSSVYRESGLGFPEFRLERAERVTFHDLTGDVALGDVVWAGEHPVLPVAVHNSSGRRMAYSIDITALQPDGVTEAASTVAWTDGIEPDETAVTEVELVGTVPDGVTFRVDGVDRHLD